MSATLTVTYCLCGKIYTNEIALKKATRMVEVIEGVEFPCIDLQKVRRALRPLRNVRGTHIRVIKMVQKGGVNES